MKLPYGYVLIGKEIVIHEEKADVVRSIFDDYLAGCIRRWRVAAGAVASGHSAA